MTGVSPYQLVYGNTIKFPIERLLQVQTEQEIEDIANDSIFWFHDTSSDPRCHKFKVNPEHRHFIRFSKEHRSKLTQMIKKRLARYNKDRKRLYDSRRIQPTHYSNLERVGVDWYVTTEGNARKLAINQRIAEIIDKVGENAYIVRYVDTGHYQPVNVDRLYKMIEIKDDPDGLTKSGRRHLLKSSSYQQRKNRRKRARAKVKKTKQNQNITDNQSQPARKRRKKNPQ